MRTLSLLQVPESVSFLPFLLHGRVTYHLPQSLACHEPHTHSSSTCSLVWLFLLHAVGAWRIRGRVVLQATYRRLCHSYQEVSGFRLLVDSDIDHHRWPCNASYELTVSISLLLKQCFSPLFAKDSVNFKDYILFKIWHKAEEVCYCSCHKQ